MTTRSSCTSILIGKKASADGSVIIGRNEDSKASWPKIMIVRPARKANAKFVSKETGVEIELPGNAMSYTATPEWTDEYGVFDSDGINPAGVAMSATESAYANARVLGFDPFTDKGINEEAMVPITLPYIHSAREGVQRLGDLITKYGTGEANGILFADHDEAWYMEVVTGHRWAAQRIPDDSFAVAANQLSIQELDFDSDDIMASADLQEFAAKNYLWQPGQSFNLRRIFGTDDQSDRVYNYPRVWSGHQQLAPEASQDETPESNTMPFIVRAEHPLQVEDAMNYLSSHYQGTIYDPAARLPHGVDSQRYRPIAIAKTQESHVLQLRQNLPNAIANIHWLAMGVPAESQYVPFFAGTTTTPANYQAGALPASLDSAYWQYKLAGVLIDAHFNHFQAKMTVVQGDVHAQHVNLIAQTDAAVDGKSDAELAQLATAATAKAAKLADEAWSKLTMDLLANSTDFSPLNFTTDPNL